MNRKTSLTNYFTHEQSTHRSVTSFTPAVAVQTPLATALMCLFRLLANHSKE